MSIELSDYDRKRVPIDWDALFAGVPRKFTRHEQRHAVNWELCPVGQMFPAFAKAVWERNAKVVKANYRLYQLGIAFGAAVKQHDFEEAERLFEQTKNMKGKNDA